MRRLRWAAAGVLAGSSVLATIRCASGGRTVDPEDIGLNAAEAAAVSGSWVFTMTTGEREIDGRLEFLFDGGELSGRLIESDGSKHPLSAARIEKGKITFTLEEGQIRDVATGAVHGDTMSGTARIERNAPEDRSGDDGSGGGERERGGFSGGFGGRGHRSGRHGDARRPPPRITWSAVRGVGADGP